MGDNILTTKRNIMFELQMITLCSQYPILDYQCTHLLFPVSLHLFLTQFAPLCLLEFLHRDRAVHTLLNLSRSAAVSTTHCSCCCDVTLEERVIKSHATALLLFLFTFGLFDLWLFLFPPLLFLFKILLPGCLINTTIIWRTNKIPGNNACTV